MTFFTAAMTWFSGMFLEPFSHGFMLRGLLVAMLTGAVAGLLSSWLVLVGWSLVGDAISHAVLPGVVVSYLLGWPFAVGALIAALLAVLLMNVVKEGSSVKSDAAIGVVFTTLFAVGLVLITSITTTTSLHGILFGNLLGIPDEVLWQVLAMCIITAVTVLVLRRRFTMYAFDPVHAHVVGMRPKVIGAILMALLALTIVAAMQAVGVILVVAMLITPGATAYLLTTRMNRMLVIAPIIGMASSWLGLLVSYHMDVSSGGVIVIAQGVLFGLAFLFAPREGVISRMVDRHRRALRTEHGAAVARPATVT